jgi:hypothetical protein
MNTDKQRLAPDALLTQKLSRTTRLLIRVHLCSSVVNCLQLVSLLRRVRAQFTHNFLTRLFASNAKFL